MVIPDEMVGSPKYGVGPNGKPVVVGRNILHPNEPAPEMEAVEDRRPDVILRAAGFESAEDWGNSILGKKNGSPTEAELEKYHKRGMTYHPSLDM